MDLLLVVISRDFRTILQQVWSYNTFLYHNTRDHKRFYITTFVVISHVLQHVVFTTYSGVTT